MATIAEQLTELVNQQKALANNLTTMGVSASETEKLNTLVPKVLEIESGIDTSDATATESDILSGYTAYVNGEKITGTYIDSGAAETFTPSNPYTPTTTDIVIETGNKLVSSDITVLGDVNLIASNIKSGVTIFGIEGTYSGSESTESILFDCTSMTTADEVVTAYSDICLADTDGGGTYTNLPTYTYKTVCAIGSSSQNTTVSGVNFNDIESGCNVYFTTPITITNSKVLISVVYACSSWITPSFSINLIQCDSVDEIPTKITNSDYAYTVNFTMNSAFNGESVILLLEDVTPGDYYIQITRTTTNGGNECTVSYLKFLSF